MLPLGGDTEVGHRSASPGCTYIRLAMNTPRTDSALHDPMVCEHPTGRLMGWGLAPEVPLRKRLPLGDALPRLPSSAPIRSSMTPSLRSKFLRSACSIAAHPSSRSTQCSPPPRFVSPSPSHRIVQDWLHDPGPRCPPRWFSGGPQVFRPRPQFHGCEGVDGKLGGLPTLHPKSGGRGHKGAESPTSRVRFRPRFRPEVARKHARSRSAFSGAFAGQLKSHFEPRKGDPAIDCGAENLGVNRTKAQRVAEHRLVIDRCAVERTRRAPRGWAGG